MKLPRVRFTVRRMMIAVMITAVLIWAERLRRLSKGYEERAESLGWEVFGASEYSPHGPEDAAHQRALVNHYRMLEDKYNRASKRPWLPVEPDPPEPK